MSFCLVLVACVEEEPDGCRGEVFDTNVGAFCAHVVIEGGFECSPEYEFGHTFEGGVICGEQRIPPEDIPTDVCAHIGSPSGCGPTEPVCGEPPPECTHCGEPSGLPNCVDGEWLCPEQDTPCPCEGDAFECTLCDRPAGQSECVDGEWWCPEGGECPFCDPDDPAPPACSTCEDDVLTSATCDGASAYWECPIGQRPVSECGACEAGAINGPACSSCADGVLESAHCAGFQWACPSGMRLEAECVATDYPSCASFGGEVCCGDRGELLGDAYCQGAERPRCLEGRVALSCDPPSECAGGQVACCDEFGEPNGEVICEASGGACESGQTCREALFAMSCDLGELGLSTTCCDEAGEATPQAECSSLGGAVRCERGVPQSTCVPVELTVEECDSVWDQGLVVSDEPQRWLNHESITLYNTWEYSAAGGLHVDFRISPSNNGSLGPARFKSSSMAVPLSEDEPWLELLDEEGVAVWKQNWRGVSPRDRSGMVCQTEGVSRDEVVNDPRAATIVFYDSMLSGSRELARFTLER